MLFCCDCYFTVTFVPSMSIHIKVWSLLHFLLRWGSVWEPAGSRVVGGWTGGPIGCQGHPCNFRIILEEFSCYSSSELSGKDKSLYAFSFFWVDRTLQPEPFCISLNKAIHVWFMLPCHSFVTQTFAMWGSAGCSDNFWLFSLPEKWGWFYTACACFPSILFHTVYLILVLAVSFVLLCRSAFEPGLGVRLKPSQPHTWFLK